MLLISNTLTSENQICALHVKSVQGRNHMDTGLKERLDLANHLFIQLQVMLIF